MGKCLQDFDLSALGIFFFLGGGGGGGLRENVDQFL